MLWTVTQSLLGGLATTFEIFILTLIFALPLGLLLAFGGFCGISSICLCGSSAARR